jgi:predicted nucleic acid-binding protein
VAAYFLDTSALVKRHVCETGSGWIRSLTGAKTPHAIYLARITAVEVTSAVTRRQRGGSLSCAQCGAILGHFRRHLAQRYRILEVTHALLVKAMELARHHGLRAYDAVQLAAALEVGRLHQAAGLGPVTLISADGELNAAATVEGLPVDDPNAHA